MRWLPPPVALLSPAWTQAKNAAAYPHSIERKVNSSRIGCADLNNRAPLRSGIPICPRT